MKKLFLVIAFIISGFTVAQSLDNYKYALVPNRFSIFKNNDYYRVSVLAKLFMQKYGFETYLDTDNQPLDFSNTNCNKVYIDLTENNNLFSTKVKVIIKDCYGKVIATSGEGISREKDYQVAYNEAVRKAFDEFPELINYSYKAGKSESTVVVKETISENNVQIEQQLSPTLNNENVKDVKLSKLFAQPISNGYQIINTEPKIILKIYKTSDSNLFIAVKDSIHGVFLSKNGQWFFEYYQNDQLVSEKVDVEL